MQLRKHSILATVVASAATLALPAVSDAATPFGSNLEREPNGSLSAPASECPPVSSPCTRVGVQFPDNDAGQFTTSPMDGVVTAFKIRANSPDQVTFRLARVNDLASKLAQAAGTGPSVTLAGSGAIETFAARVPVRTGDYVALDSAQTTATYGNDGGTRQLKYGPVLTDGQGPRAAGDKENSYLELQAVVEPDADHDGFGDETQDKCPTNASAQGDCPIAPKPDVTKPVVSGGTAAGSQVLYRLSEAARVTFRVEKRTIGRKASRKRCAKLTKANKRRGRCVRYVRVAGSFSDKGEAGLNVVRFTGRIGGRKLAPGRYRLVGTATDKAGNVSKAFRIAFAIKK
jgi:hypothetical protein